VTVAVREARDADAGQIAEIVADVMSGPDPVGFEEPLTPVQVREWRRRQGEFGALLVAEEDGRIVGFASVDFDSAMPRDCSFGAWVRRDSRRRGVATALAERALTFARERGYRRIRGRLPEHNEAALSFLSSVGPLVPLQNPGASFLLPIEEGRG
jgi:GNAT superfamily N-acetyltransferase